MSKKRAKKPLKKNNVSLDLFAEQSTNKLPILNIALITIICFMPFIDKAFHIDDTLFLWKAEQIIKNPADFYGFTANWEGTEMAMSDITKNPPLASYYIAIVALFFGWSEIALHLAFIIPAVAVTLGTYFLAAGICARPQLAALSTMFTPVFLISSTNIMCDTMMLAFWVWSIFLWLRGLEKNQSSLLVVSAFLIAASALTKYFGMSLIPLLFAYSLFKKRELGYWAFFLLIPVAILSIYEWYTYAIYGKGLIKDAASYSTEIRQAYNIGILLKGLVGLAFTGGCIIIALFYSHLLWSRRTIIYGLLVAMLFILILPFVTKAFRIIGSDEIYWGVIAQFCVFSMIGASILAISVIDFWKNRDPISLLLLLWIFGTFMFTTFINWSINGRSILPMTPAVGIILMRRIDNQAGFIKQKNYWTVLLPLIPAAALSLLLALSDYTLANTARSASDKISAKYQRHNSTVWFQGHWGFQYYMEQKGFKPLDVRYSTLKQGDLIVTPSFNIKRFTFFEDALRPMEEIRFYPISWVSTFSPTVGAGFYAHMAGGPLPFGFGSVPPEKYAIRLVVVSGKFSSGDNK